MIIEFRRIYMSTTQLTTRDVRLKSKKNGDYLNALTSYQARKYTQTLTQTTVNLPITDTDSNLYYSEYILNISQATTITCTQFESDYSDFLIITVNNNGGTVIFGNEEIISDSGRYYLIFNKQRIVSRSTNNRYNSSIIKEEIKYENHLSF